MKWFVIVLVLFGCKKDHAGRERTNGQAVAEVMLLTGERDVGCVGGPENVETSGCKSVQQSPFACVAGETMVRCSGDASKACEVVHPRDAEDRR